MSDEDEGEPPSSILKLNTPHRSARVNKAGRGAALFQKAAAHERGATAVNLEPEAKTGCEKALGGKKSGQREGRCKYEI